MEKSTSTYDHWISLDIKEPIWRHFFTVAPLVVIGTKENDHYDMAPKHMVTALGHENYFGFVCTPSHATYHNVKKENAFSVSFVRPSQVVLASLAATPRCDESENEKSIIRNLPTKRAEKIDALFIQDSYLLLECILDKIVDGFGNYSLIAGKVIRAYVHQNSKKFSETDEGAMIYQNPLLAFIAYGRFAEIKETLDFPFPRDFERKLIDQ